jgi:hypothetical protein
VYTLEPAKDIVISSISLGLTVSSLFINRSANNVSRDNIPFSHNSVNVFDRSLMYGYNKSADIVSDIFLYGLMAMPVLSLLDKYKRPQSSGNLWRYVR